MQLKNLVSKKVLVVDDDENIVELFKHILSRENLTVFVAYDGTEALLKVENLKPDIIILDLMLPKQGGFQVLKNLQQNETTKEIPVMIITGKFTDGTTYEFLKSQPNVKGFYSKPIDIANLVLDIKKVLETERRNNV
ncbi:MAG: response regulator [Elusimicrobiota bacterium]